MKNQIVFISNLDAYLLIVERAQANGKKAGDSMQEEFDEVVKEHPEWFEFKGLSEKDADQITGDLREKGFKIINPHEIDRRKEQEKYNE